LAESVIRFAGGGLTVSPPLSLYIHLPWCVKKCPYCDFNSHAAQALPEAAYIDALLVDLERALPDIWGRRIHTVFFGGGTPSLFSAEGIDRILTGVRTLTQLMPGAEITLEANPPNSRAFARRALRVFRLASRVSTRAISRRSGAFTMTLKRAARLSSPPPISTPLTST
jgi:coproporphyrinogen III oxidase-like Fe-S oxidoreductase